MTPAEYAEYVDMRWFADSQYGILAAALGLGGEAGEVVDEIKKAAFHDHCLHHLNNISGSRRRKVLEELGDVLYYFTAMLNELGWTYGEIAELNKQKLDTRYGEPTRG